MPVYSLSTCVRSNVPVSYRLYDLCIYHMDSQRNKHILVNVTQQLFKDNYETQNHPTCDTHMPASTICIMEVILYRKNMLKTVCVSPTPFTKMYTLEAFASGRAFSPVKRENPCYFESKGTPKLVSEGGETKVIQITRPERPFIAEEYPIGHPLDPFEQNIIAKQIGNRFDWVDFPMQQDASLCGPAAFFYCLQKDRPDVYAQAAKELWQYGKTTIGKLEINPGDTCLHPTGTFYNDKGWPKIKGIDWMTLAGLRDSENSVLSFDKLDSPLAGITMWETLTEWFEKAGYEKVFSNVGITQAGVQGIRDLNDYAHKGYWIVTLINDGLLEMGTSSLTIPTHWIVWQSSLTQETTGSFHLNLFSWGLVDDQIKAGQDASFFIKRFFGGMVFKPL